MEITALVDSRIALYAYFDWIPPECSNCGRGTAASYSFFGGSVDASGYGYLDLCSPICVESGGTGARSLNGITPLDLPAGAYELRQSVENYSTDPNSSPAVNTMDISIYVISGSIDSPSASGVPEPGSIALFGSGIGLLLLWNRYNRKRTVSTDAVNGLHVQHVA